MDAFAAELTTLIQAADDKQLVTLVARAQRASARFGHVVDHKAAVDIGDFFAKFGAQCSAIGNDLSMKLAQAKADYEDMLVAAGYGSGTNAGATGVAIFFPLR
jgi:hypothetical protein